MSIDKNFLGRNGFIWFTGVVEDRLDPQYTGRVRVRCIGFHTQDKAKLPTADLPWATCLLPTTTAGISGLGNSPSALVEGSWVIGYFRQNYCITSTTHEKKYEAEQCHYYCRNSYMS